MAIFSKRSDLVGWVMISLLGAIWIAIILYSKLRTNEKLNNNNDNNLYLKRVTQSNDKDLPWGPLACLQVARGPQGYKVVQYIALRYCNLQEGRDSAHLIASVKPFQTLGPAYEIYFWPIDLLHFGRANSEDQGCITSTIAMVFSTF